MAEAPTPATLSAAATEVFKFPSDGELLTVAKLEQMLAEHEKKAADAAESTPELQIDTQDTSVIDIFEELTKESPAAEKAQPASLNLAQPADLNVQPASLNLVQPADLILAQPILDYDLPFNLLEQPADDAPQPDMEALRAKADLLLGKLRDFNVDGTIREICPGPVVTLFELEPAPGIKISKIANLENDLALTMSAMSIRIIAPIPGKAAVGIEIPNEQRQTVKLRELLETEEFDKDQSPLAVAFGKDIS
ncbi:MAG: hypothetical protein LBV04_09225, partial [Deferribacteraceae bacterium]|nr:hypothetical protein [Deferribacteraceae bacterium]